MNEKYLEQICMDIFYAGQIADAEHKKELFGDQFVPELLIMKKSKVKIEIRERENNHKSPHIHISHSDKFDVSLSLPDFSVLAGSIDSKTKKYIMNVLMPKKNQLMKIWTEVNVNGNPRKAEVLIDALGLKK